MASHLRTESSLVILNVVPLVQWHHVISDFDEKFDGAETGGEPAGVLFYLQLLANTHGGLTFTTDTVSWSGHVRSQSDYKLAACNCNDHHSEQSGAFQRMRFKQ